jgi:anti-sigma B factor antagonist
MSDDEVLLTPFGIEIIRASDEIVLVELRGELDISTAPVLRDALADPIDDGVSRIVVDATRVTFLDSTGLGVFLGARQRLPEAGELLIACGDQLQRLFRLVALDEQFRFFPTGEQALRAASRRPLGRWPEESLQDDDRPKTLSV